jgi:hypothetical protein
VSITPEAVTRIRELQRKTEQQDNGTLVSSLAILAKGVLPDSAETRLASSVIVDELAKRSPWVEAALEAWEADLGSPLTTAEVALLAGRGMAPLGHTETRGAVNLAGIYPPAA